MIVVPLTRAELSSLFQECIYDECYSMYSKQPYTPNKYLKQLRSYVQQLVNLPVPLCVVRLVYSNEHNSLTQQLQHIDYLARNKQKKLTNAWMVCVGAGCVLRKRIETGASSDKLVFEMCAESRVMSLPLQNITELSTLPVASADKYLRIIFGSYE
jgi:hypothetical protein